MENHGETIGFCLSQLISLSLCTPLASRHHRAQIPRSRDAWEAWKVKTHRGRVVFILFDSVWTWFFCVVDCSFSISTRRTSLLPWFIQSVKNLPASSQTLSLRVKKKSCSSSAWPRHTWVVEVWRTLCKLQTSVLRYCSKEMKASDDLELLPWLQLQLSLTHPTDHENKT